MRLICKFEKVFLVKLLVCFFMSLLFLLITTRTMAATFTVINLNNSGGGSLRDAIDQANAAMGADDIVFAPGLMGTIMLGSTLPNITDADGLTIDGGDSITISGSNALQVFFVNPGAELTLENLTVEDAGDPNVAGGGVRNDGLLTVLDCTFAGNSANNGGGIFNNSSATATIMDSTFSHNNVPTFGGGIRNRGMLTVINSTFEGNIGNSSSGGIDNEGNLIVINSTFSGNSTGMFGQGGGITNVGGIAGVTLTVINSTFTGNSAANGGGGIINSMGASAELLNTIMADNPGGNCLGTITDGGFNIDDGATCGFMVANNSLPNTNPELDPTVLQDNGGPTQTIALEPTSPAIDAIPVADCTDTDGNPVETDQRGVIRPQGMDCDIGAFESKPLDLSISKSADKDPVKRGKNLAYTIMVSNEGDEEANGVIMNDPLPVSTTYVSSSTSQGSCTNPPVGSTGTLSCSLGTIDRGEGAAVNLVVKVNARGKTTISNTASVNSLTPDSNNANNSATLLTNVFGSRK
ncbi:MAG TPA: choice-of-anchor Q domain-containing protein [Thermodesulfobacteriota bacterium]